MHKYKYECEYERKKEEKEFKKVTSHRRIMNHELEFNVNMFV